MHTYLSNLPPCRQNANHGPIFKSELERLNATLVNHKLELTVFAGELKNEDVAIVKGLQLQIENHNL